MRLLKCTGGLAGMRDRMVAIRWCLCFMEVKFTEKVKSTKLIQYKKNSVVLALSEEGTELTPYPQHL